MTPAVTPKRPASWRDLLLILGLSFRVAPVRATVVVLLTVLARASETLFAWIFKVVIDGAIAGDQQAILWGAIGTGAVMGIALLAGLGGFYIRLGLSERVARRVDGDILELTATIPGIEHQERADFLDELTLLRDKREAIGMSVGAVVENIGLFVRLAASVLLLSRVHPALVALPLFAVPSVWAGGVGTRWVIRAFERSAEPRRRAELLYELSTTPGPAKEIRIFGTAETMIRRHEADLIDFDRWSNSARVRATGLSAAGWLVFAVGYISMLVLVAREAVAGRATVGDVALAMTLAGQVNSQVSGFVQTVTWALDTLRTVGRYRWLRDYARDHAPAPATHEVPARLREGIRFESVDFTYPGTDTPILRDVDLLIPAGATVAIVGDNGAGKSTLVKLLGRFYEPSSGRILVDDAPLSGMDPERWRERMSAGFQDHARYEMAAADVVGIGSLPDREDDDAVLGALDRASARDVVTGLPSKLRTNLGRSFHDGIELSGGQWQKLALGRGMMREDPLLLVLDEPTASLDAETEHALFERYAAAARRVGRDTGTITVFVSHRFSTVRMADVIVVIDDGRVVEQGSHSELIARAGLYAELYEIQARQYR